MEKNEKKEDKTETAFFCNIMSLGFIFSPVSTSSPGLLIYSAGSPDYTSSPGSLIYSAGFPGSTSSPGPLIYSAGFLGSPIPLIY